MAGSFPGATAAGVLRRNPNSAAVMLASGLQRTATMLAATLGFQNLRVMVWGDHAAQYTATMSMCLNILAMLSGGVFGRFGDRVGRRVAAAIYGCASFLPAWTLMVFGFNEAGLYASSVAFVLSGIGLSSDALLVLANDATLPQDRSEAFGIFQAATNGISFILFGVPALFTTVLDLVPNPSIMQWLWYNVVLNVAFFAVIFFVKVRDPAQENDTSSEDCESEPRILDVDGASAGPSEDSTQTPASDRNRSDSEGLPPAGHSVDIENPQHLDIESRDEFGDLDLRSVSSRSARSPRTSGHLAAAGGSAGAALEPQDTASRSRFTSLSEKLAWFPLAQEVRMMLSTSALRSLYLCAVLLAFSGDVVFDLGSQFFRDELGLLSKSATLKEEQTVSVLTTIPAQILIIPGAMVVGYLAGQWGSLRLLRCMIPVAAVMTLSGASMALIPKLWMVPIVCVMQNYAALAGNVPLKRLVAEAAPEGKVGEAMGVLGMVNQAISFVANAVIAVATPILYRHMSKPLWTAYVVCGFLTLVAGFAIVGLTEEKVKRSHAVESEPKTVPKVV